MSEQLNMDDLFGDTISAVGEPHLACVLLLDISGSMTGEPIYNLNQAVKRFKSQVCEDEVAKKRVDVAVVAFSTNVEVVSEFVPISKMPIYTLQAQGRTNMAEGIQKAIDLVKERNYFYQQLGVPCFKPWIFMITDGASTSEPLEMEMAAERIQTEENKGSVGKLKFWALGIGNYDKQQLFKLTKRVIELRDHNFTGIFDWLSDSMTAISQSQVGQNVELDILPPNARKALADRAIDEDW